MPKCVHECTVTHMHECMQCMVNVKPLALWKEPKSPELRHLPISVMIFTVAGTHFPG